MMLIHHLLPSPRHSHTSSISSFWVGKLGREMKTRRNPGATDHETRSAPGAGERDRDREKAMVFLDVLVNWGCRRCLHKEDYSFE